MSKIIKTLVFLLIIFLLFNLTAFATDINMNLTQEESDTQTQNVDSENTNNTENETIVDDVGGVAAPSGVSSIAQENMSFSNILNILIITVGVILILLAIAILIRLKN